MSFREKSDWVSFISLGLFLIYFGGIARGIMTGTPTDHPFFYFVLFWSLVGVLVVVQVVTHIVLAVRSPSDARTPVDERERLIHLRATRPAYFFLLVGAFLTMGTLHMNFTAWQVAHCVLAVIWLAEWVRYGLRLYYYHHEV